MAVTQAWYHSANIYKHIGRGMFYTRPRRLLGVSRANSRGTLLFVQGCLAWFVMEGTQYSQWLLLLRRSQRKLTANLKQSRAPVTMVPHCSPSSHSELKVFLTLQKPTPSIHHLMPTIKLNRHQVQQWACFVSMAWALECITIPPAGIIHRLNRTSRN